LSVRHSDHQTRDGCGRDSGPFEEVRTIEASGRMRGQKEPGARADERSPSGGFRQAWVVSSPGSQRETESDEHGHGGKGEKQQQDQRQEGRSAADGGHHLSEHDLNPD
jgi:hypothetical protein